MSNSFAFISGHLVTDLVEVTDDLSKVDAGGKWLLVGYFSGPVLAFRFQSWQETDVPPANWYGSINWTSDTSEQNYIDLVKMAQAEISAGNFYQVNVCHQYQSNWDERNHIQGLFKLLTNKYPAKYSTLISIEDDRLLDFGMNEIKIASVSPELFLKISDGVISSSPIKGTVVKGERFLEKDEAENIMIVDLVRNDLAQVCETASVVVPQLLTRVELPNLDHLVSSVSGKLRKDVGWSQIIQATFPPGSVTGAPKSSALKFIETHEAPREIYCGTLGWIDSDEKKAELAVAIRTFWKSGNLLKFGAGAGITWGSEAPKEWQETELKAKRLIEIASETFREDE